MHLYKHYNIFTARSLYTLALLGWLMSLAPSSLNYLWLWIVQYIFNLQNWLYRRYLKPAFSQYFQTHALVPHSLTVRFFVPRALNMTRAPPSKRFQQPTSVNVTVLPLHWNLRCITTSVHIMFHYPSPLAKKMLTHYNQLFYILNYLHFSQPSSLSKHAFDRVPIYVQVLITFSCDVLLSSSKFCRLFTILCSLPSNANLNEKISMLYSPAFHNLPILTISVVLSVTLKLFWSSRTPFIKINMSHLY